MAPRNKKLQKVKVSTTSDHIYLYGTKVNTDKIIGLVSKLRGRINTLVEKRERRIAKRVLRAFNYLNSLTPKQLIALSKIINVPEKIKEEDMLHMRVMGRTLHEIGLKYGISREWVRRVTDKLLDNV